MTQPPYTIEQVDNPSPEIIKTIKDGMRDFNMHYGYNDIIRLAVFLRDHEGNIHGGVYGELGMDWLYIDLLWVADKYKGKGYGRLLMHSIEQYALHQGVANIHLATTAFQALPFYYYVGYRLFGIIEDRPPGYNYYYLRKHVQADDKPTLKVIVKPPHKDIVAIARGLGKHNQDQGINNKAHRVNILLKNDNDEVVGGLLGAIYWGWLDLQTFWIHESLRQQGYGTKMLNLAEQLCIEHNAPHIALDIIDFQGLPFFGNHGFNTFATLHNRPNGHTTYFVAKSL